MEPYEVYTKDINYLIRVRSRRHAIASIFLKVKRGEISITELGQLIMVKGPLDDDEVPFRTFPTLLNMGLIDEGRALTNVVDTLYDRGPEDLPDREIDKLSLMINKACEQDRWILDVVKELESLTCPICGRVVASDPDAPQARGLLSIHIQAKHRDQWKGSLEETLSSLGPTESEAPRGAVNDPVYEEGLL